VVAVPKIVAHLLGTDTLQELSRGMLVALWRRRALVTSVLAAAARRSRSPGLAVTNEFACFRSFVRIMRQMRSHDAVPIVRRSGTWEIS
jgi:hypothetical protein